MTRSRTIPIRTTAASFTLPPTVQTLLDDGRLHSVLTFFNEDEKGIFPDPVFHPRFKLNLKGVTTIETLEELDALNDLPWKRELERAVLEMQMALRSRKLSGIWTDVWLDGERPFDEDGHSYLLETAQWFLPHGCVWIEACDLCANVGDEHAGEDLTKAWKAWKQDPQKNPHPLEEIEEDALLDATGCLVITDHTRLNTAHGRVSVAQQVATLQERVFASTQDARALHEDGVLLWPDTQTLLSIFNGPESSIENAA